MAIAVAPNGARRSKADHPALPLSPAELAREAAACLERGAAMLRLHVRDRDGRHLLDAGAYGEASRAIRAAVGQRLVVQVTTEAVGLYRPDQQVALVEAVRPEAASLALRELAPETSDEPRLVELLGWMARERIAAQVILYDAADTARLAALRGRRPAAQAAGARSTCSAATPPASGTAGRAAAVPRAADDHRRPWMLCAFGPDEAACACAAALLGGDVRVGFENNLHRPDGSLANGNADLVEDVAAPSPGSAASC